VFERYQATHPGINVYEFERLWLPGASWGAAEVMSVAGTAGPEILALNYTELGGYVREGLIQPVDDLYEGWMEKDRWPQSLTGGLKLEGRTWGVIAMADYGMLVGNREVFAAKKLSEKNMPKTWAELGKTAARLAVPGKVAGLAFISQVDLANIWLAAARSVGGEDPVKLTGRGIEVNLSCESSRRAAQALADLGNAIRPAGPTAMTVQEKGLQTAFLEGKVALALVSLGFVDERWDKPDGPYVQSSRPLLAPIPGPLSAEPLAVSFRTFISVIPSYVKAPAIRHAIWDYYVGVRDSGSFLERQALEMAVNENIEFLPTNYLAKYPGHPALAKFPAAWGVAVASAMRNAQVLPPDREWGEFALIMGPALFAMMKAGTPPAAVLQDVQQKFDEVVHNKSRHTLAKWKVFGWGILGLIVTFMLVVLVRLVILLKNELRDYRNAPIQAMTGAKWAFSMGLFFPAIILSVAFGVVPLFMGLKMSLFTNVLREGGVFIGLENFYDVIISPLAQTAVINTMYYMLISFFLCFLGPLILALVIANVPRGAFLIRTAFFLPAVASSVVVALLWQQMYDIGGAFNSLVSLLGFPPRDWLAEPSVAMFATVLPQAWATLGISGLVYLASISSIPEALYEDAEMQGAGITERFLNVTLPHIRPVIGITLVGWLMSAARTAEQVFLLTQGGPENRTYVIGLDIFNQAYVYIKFGYAMAEVWLMVSVILVFSIYQMRAVRTGQLKVLGV
jgi:multiple sugar transport system permease protein